MDVVEDTGRQHHLVRPARGAADDRQAVHVQRKVRERRLDGIARLAREGEGAHRGELREVGGHRRGDRGGGGGARPRPGPSGSCSPRHVVSLNSTKKSA